MDWQKWPENRLRWNRTFLRPNSLGAPQQYSAKDIVRAGPTSSSGANQSGLIGFLNRREEEKAEATQRKLEKRNEVMLKNQKEREEKAVIAYAESRSSYSFEIKSTRKK